MESPQLVDQSPETVPSARTLNICMALASSMTVGFRADRHGRCFNAYRRKVQEDLLWPGLVAEDGASDDLDEFHSDFGAHREIE